ncbi:non-ribosomal peptide synthetase, partial [Gordonia neofelifaecis]
DLVRRLPDGGLEYLGRTDFQVKLRGQRIELGEIEAVLAGAPGVVHAATTVASAPGGGEHLVGYLAAAPGESVDLEAVKAVAEDALAGYMVPSVWMVLEDIALNTAGKIDRKALPAPEFGSLDAEFVAPEGPVEAAVAQAFADVLGVERVGVTDDFFDVGGNSLSAMRLVARAGEALGVELSVRDLFDAPTVRDLVAASAGRAPALAPITAVDPRPDLIPLSFAQQRMWFINQFDPEIATYNIPSVMRLTGPLDYAALRAAFGDLVARHEVLRTTFPSVDGRPVQRVHRVDEIDRRLDFAVVATRAELETAVGSGFDVSAEWPIRVRIWQTSEDECIVAVVAHHIAADGESRAPLVTDVLTAYAARRAGTPPTATPLAVQFADYAIWQHEVLGDPADAQTVAGRQLDYWRRTLSGLPDVLDLPADRPRPQVASQSGAHSSFTVPAPLARRVEEIAVESGATPFMVLHAALAVLLARMSATDDIAVATPVAGRGQAIIDPLIGMFVNTLVLRSEIDPSGSFADLLAQIRTTDLDAFGNADVPFEVVVDAVDPVRSEAFAPLAQVMLALDQDRAASSITIDGLTVEQVEPPSIAAQLDLAVHVAVSADDDWAGTLIYATDLFDASTADEFGARFVRLLDGLTQAPDRTVADADVITADQRSTAVALGNGPAVDVVDQTVADAVAAQIARTPDERAISFEGRSVSYAELGHRVSALARDLIAAGVGPDTAVAVCIDRSVEMMVAIHAVLAAGGQYVPVDTAAPTDRARYMLETAAAKVLLVAADNPVTDVVFAAAEAGARLMRVDAQAPIEPSAPITDADRLAPMDPDNAAYTLFTSGSTGRPKGVTVSHRAILNRLRWGLAEFAWTTGDRIVQKTPYTFDVSVPELFAPLMTGATVIVARPGGHTDPDYLIDLLETAEATSVHFVPSMLSVFLDVVDPTRLAALTSLRWVFASGEALPPAVVARAHRALPGVGIHNLFGPTEAAVEVTWADVSDAPDPVTIGRPVWNTSALVLDARLRAVPTGVPGELYLGGVQVARGYAAQPGLSAERFVADPFGAPGARLYRTGDLVRRRANGDIEYLGRTDFQVKLRGQRIELGEIESVLAAAPGVVHAAATVATAPTGAEHLVAYVAPATVDLDAVKTAVDQALPEYMRPSVWTVLDDIALNSAGKIDRRALPEPEFASADSEYVAPEGDAEERLAAVVAGIMGHERVSVTESFFAMGGDSIMSIQLASAARAAGIELSPREIFEHRTVRAMAAAAGSAVLPMLPEPAGGGSGASAIPPVVAWMIEHAQQPSDFADFSQTAVIAAPEGLELADLARLLDAVVRVHPMLSAQLSKVPAENDAADNDAADWALVTGTPFDAQAAVAHIAADAPLGSERFDDALRAAHAGAAGRLDPATGSLVQAVHVTDPTGAGRVVVVIHHLGVDAVSWQAIIEDLVTGWAQLSAGEPIALRPEGTSARAWAGALADQAQSRTGELDYWLTRLPEHPTSFGTALDPSRDRDSASSSLLHTLPAELTEKVLSAVPDALQGNVNDVLLGGLARAVRGWQNDRGIVDDAPVTVLLESHGRVEDLLVAGDDPHRADLSRSVGWFTSIAPTAIDPAGDIVHAMKAAKQERLGQPDAGVGFGLLRYAARTELANRPLPSIIFNFLGAGASGGGAASVDLPFMSADGPAFPPSVGGAMSALAALTINSGTTVESGERRIWVDFRFPDAILEPADAENIVHRWENELAAAADLVDRGVDLGLSPSDVPGSGVTQQDLDRIADRHPGADVWPLTPLQRGLYFQSRLAAASAPDHAETVDVYVTQAVLHLGGEVDVERLRRAATELLASHRALRSSFVETASGAVVAVVPERVEVPWRVVELDGASNATDEVAALAAAEKLDPFDMTAAPLMRVVVVRHPEGTSVVLTNHHILFDGWSGPLVMADLLALYATGATYTGAGTSPTDFADYARRVGAVDEAAAAAAWTEVLAPITEPTFAAPAIEVTAEAMPRDLRTQLGAELTTAVEDVSRTSGATVSTVLQFAWALLISRYTGNRVVSFGETVSGRPADLDGVESMVGLFINTLPVVVDVDPAASAAEVLAALQADKVKVLDHQHLGLSELTALTGLSGLFDTSTVYESYPVDTDSLTSADTGAAGDGLEILGADVSDATHYPLNLSAAPTAEGILLTLKYLPTAFSDRQVEVFADALRQILTGIAADLDRRIGDIPLVSRAGGAHAMLPLSAPALEPMRLIDLIAARDLDPEHPAIIAGDEVISYADFEARTNRVARGLIAQGVGPEDIVAVALERSVESVTAVWGTVKSGAAFVAVDPAHPDERITAMLDDTRSRFGITRSQYASRLSAFDPTWLLVEELAFADIDGSDLTDADRNGVHRIDDLAYLVFTSGTTGRPKAVANTSRGLATLVEQLHQISGTRRERPDARVLHLASPSFDASFFEILWALANGHTMVIVPPSDYAGPALDAILHGQSVTDLVVTPSVLATLDSTATTGLRNLAVAGEACPPELVDRWATTTAAGRRMWNFYGPSETTVQASDGVLQPGAPITMGELMPGFTGYLLDEHLHPVPRGFVGELYLSAPASLGRGYLKRPGLTATRFVADPFAADGRRMYATGDMVRINDDGHPEYAGRSDFQVKIAGQRIELAEVETVFAEQDGVATAVVVGVGKPATSLAAYLVPENGAEVSVDDLRDAARRRLPSFMVPASIMLIDEIPINAVGKLDRRALPEPEAASTEYVAPGTPEEEIVARAFAEVLDLDRVGVTASFFDLGGNSLSATRLVARVSEALGVEVSVRDAFSAPTVRDLVHAVAGRDAALEPVTAVIPRPETVPLSFAQTRMWFINRLEPESPVYNLPAVLRIRGALDVDALYAAVIDVVGRHEVLRTTFPDVDGQPYQNIARKSAVAARLDWAIVDSQAEIEVAAMAGFDLTSQWPVRVRVWEVSGDEFVLAVITHHIASDGESQLPLVSDLLTAYLARAQDETPEFAPLDIQYADFALWQHRVLGSPDDADSVVGRQLGYWRERLAGLPDVLELPADRARPAVATHDGRNVTFEIPAAVAARIGEVAKTHGVTPFMVVHGAFAVLLARLSATDDIAVATPIAGRGQRELDSLVGMFINTLVLRAHVDPAMAFTALLDQLREADVDAFAHADVPFETVVDAVDPVRSQAFAPLAQVILSFDPGASVSDVDLSIAGLEIEPLEAEHVPAQVDLYVEVASRPDGSGWLGSITYATDLFDASTVDQTAQRFVAALDGLTAMPSTAVGDVPILTEADLSAEAALEWGPARDLPAVTSIPEAVAAQIAATPDAIALLFGDREVSYAEFGARVNTLARELISAGVGPDVAVALCIPRSVEMMVAIHAVLAAGGQYVPIDTAAPGDRAEYMLNTAGAQLLLVSDPAEVADVVFAAASTGVRLVRVDASVDVDPAAAPVADADRGALHGDSAAYTLFTSGSTGMPKGVTLSHEAVLNRLWWGLDELPIGGSDRVVQKTPYTFDCSVTELFAPLMAGSTLVVLKAGGHLEPQYVASEIARTRATMVHFVPSMLSVFLEVVGADRIRELDSVRIVSCTGEALPP